MTFAFRMSVDLYPLGTFVANVYIIFAFDAKVNCMNEPMLVTREFYFGISPQLVLVLVLVSEGF